MKVDTSQVFITYFEEEEKNVTKGDGAWGSNQIIPYQANFLKVPKLTACAWSPTSLTGHQPIQDSRP